MNTIARIVINDFSRKLNDVKMSTNLEKSGKYITDNKKFKKYAMKSLNCMSKKIELAAEEHELMQESSLSDNIIAGFLEGTIGAAGVLAVLGGLLKVLNAVRRA